MDRLTDLIYSVIQSHVYSVDFANTIVNIIICTFLAVLFQGIWEGMRVSSRPESKIRFKALIAPTLFAAMITPSLVEMFIDTADWSAFIVPIAATTYFADVRDSTRLAGLIKAIINIFVSITRREKITDEQIDPNLHGIKPEEDKDNGNSKKNI